MLVAAVMAALMLVVMGNFRKGLKDRSKGGYITDPKVLIGISSPWIYSHESDSCLYLLIKSLYKEPPKSAKNRGPFLPKNGHFEISL